MLAAFILFSMVALLMGAALVTTLLIYRIRQMDQVAGREEEKGKTLQLYKTVLNSLSHEFRTPISTIIGAADNLLEEPSRLSAGDSRRLLSSIAGASLRLNRQVENLLNMSRMESGMVQPKMEWCDIRDLVSVTLSQLEEPLAGHRVNTEIPESLPLVKLDYGWMEQVLTNLIYNACLYTPKGSLIRIAADCPDENLVITVEDNGDGIPEEEIGKVFDKFYRPRHSRAGGSGLGLSIVKGFVEAHEGKIDLRNAPEGGARFVIRIPAEKLSIKQTGKWVLEKY